MQVPDEFVVCQLCQRGVPAGLITLHHLTPKQKGGRAEDRTPLCRPCHKQIHATFSNTDLLREFSSLERLRAAPQMQAFLGWIRKQKAGRNFKTTTSTSHSGRRGQRLRIRQRSR